MWKPKRTLEECHAIMKAPGSLLELEDVVIDGETYRWYKHAPLTLRQEWLDTAKFGPREYIVYQDERYTYAEIHQRVKELANLFSTKYGCKVGDRIAIGARNSPDWIIAFWATQVIGCVTVAVNCWLPPSVIEHCIIFGECKLVILDHERAEIMGKEKASERIKTSGVKGILVLRSHERGGKIPAEMKRLEDEVKPFRGIKEVPEAKVGPEDIATIFYTSGTTGLPKGVVGTQRAFIANLFNSFVSPRRAILRNGDDIPPPDPKAPQRNVLIGTPQFHATATHSVLQVSTYSGSKVILLHKWTPEAAIDIILKEKCNTAGGIPYMASALLSDSRLTASNSNIQAITWGGGPAPSQLAARLVERFGNRGAVAQGYGATELSSIGTTFSGEDFLARPTSSGLPAFTMDIKILDPEGRQLPPGDGPNAGCVGEIYMRGCNRAKCYWRDEKATREAFLPGGWFKTGDLGYVDKEGFVYIVDRAKDIIIRGGENIASAAVEDALYKDLRLEDVSVVPIPDEALGELVGAAVTTRAQYHNQVTPASIIERVAKLLPRHCVPVFVDVRAEALPKNPVGKTLKKELKAEIGKLWEESKKGRAKL